MWVALHPEDPLALEFYGLLQSRRGDWAGLVQTLETRYRLSPANHSLLKELAGARENLGDDDGARAALEQYTTRMPADYTGHAALARIHRRLGAHDIAREHIERAIVVEPLNPEPVIELALLDLHVGRFDEARAGLERTGALARTPRQRAHVLDQQKEYYRFRGRMEDAIRTAEAWPRTASDAFAPLNITLRRSADIDLYLEAGRHEDAAKLLEALRSQLEAFGSGPFYYALFPEIHIALEAGELALARATHLAATDWIENWDADMLQSILIADLGRIEETAGNYEEAIRHYRDALSQDDGRLDVQDVHRRLGGALRKAGRLDEAEAQLREALRLVPSDPHTHLEMATVLEARGDIEGAASHLESALAAWEPADESFKPAREARARAGRISSTGRAAVPTAGPGSGQW